MGCSQSTEQAVAQPASAPKSLSSAARVDCSSTEQKSSSSSPLAYKSCTPTPLSGSSSSSKNGYLPSSDHSDSHKSLPKMNKPTLVRQTSAIDQINEIRKEDGTLKSRVVHLEVPYGKPIEEVYDGVHNGPILGSGNSGEVRLVTHKATGVNYAVKCLDLGSVKAEGGLQQLREEIVTMCQLDHPNIVRLEEVYESHSEIYLVQELCLGGDLFDRLDAQPNYHYTEAQCARLVKQMLSSVRYLHSKGIVHRDVKLENFLFSSTSPDSELKMIDFGLSKHFQYGDVQTEAVGTPYTTAPEIIRGSYDEKCDIWAIGVITFLLLSGSSPFGGCGEPGQNLATLTNKILKGSFKFEPVDVWATVSPQARDFIKTLLVTNPQTRPSAVEAQQHPWVLEWCNLDSSEDGNRLSPSVVQALVSFREYSDMRKLLCEVLSFTLLPEQIKDLRKEFEKMDTDGSGEISLSALKQVLVENAGSGSLGALTEEEVEDIFNAMRVRKSEQRIQWHEFIAAGISQCQVDDRNLRLAFDRLDSDHKGYITLENVMDLIGEDASESEEAMRKMWGDSMKAVNCQQAHISYDDFLLLMKGQMKETDHEQSEMSKSPSSSAVSEFTPVRHLRRKSRSSPMVSGRGIFNEPVDESSPHFAADTRRVLLLPEHMHNEEVIEDLINDRTKSPLVVNRALYRAHRQMRLAVLEASKRFEEEQARRARDILLAESAKETGSVGAGLVMRRQKSTNEVSPEAVRRFLRKNQEQQQTLIQKASSRGGRVRRTRMKTTSDMSGMLRPQPGF